MSQMWSPFISMESWQQYTSSMYYNGCKRVIRVGCKYLKLTMDKIWQVLMEPLKHLNNKRSVYCSPQWKGLKLFRPWKLSSVCCSGNTAVLPPLYCNPASLSHILTAHTGVPRSWLFTALSIYKGYLGINPGNRKERISLQLTVIAPTLALFAADSPLFSSTDSFTKTLSLETVCFNMKNLLWPVCILALTLKDIPFLSGKRMATLALFQFLENICINNTYVEV